MYFVQLPTRDGYQTWGCRVGQTSLVIGFDGRYPDHGYSASLKVVGREKVLLGEGFATKAEARRALQAALSKQN